MTDKTKVKICGLRTPQDVAAAAAAMADYVGFVFFEKSPRHLSLAQAAGLSQAVPLGIIKVGLVVDPTDDALDVLMTEVPLDMLQLHGHERPERVAEIRDRTGLSVMKAVGIADASDMDALDGYMAVADQILVDSKPPRDADLPGGNGLSFDWRLLEGRSWSVPWMLAGGLHPANVAEAVKLTGATQVDVSSGVESAPGEKDPARIRDFIAAARS